MTMILLFSKFCSIFCIILVTLVTSDSSFSQIKNPAEYDKFSNSLKTSVRLKAEPILKKYCHNACEILGIDIDVQEEVIASEDIGFEEGSGPSIELYANRIEIEVQIDNRITAKNRELLARLLKQNTARLGKQVDVLWREIEIPRIGADEEDSIAMKAALKDRIRRNVHQILETYCPTHCVLSDIRVEGSLTNAEDVSRLNPKNFIRDSESNTYLKIQEIGISLTLDEKLRAEERERILTLLRARMRFVEPVVLDTLTTSFPMTETERRAQLRQDSQDPYGLEKLRKTLEIFKELAGTKEIITTSETSEKLAQERRESLSSELKSERQTQSELQSQLESKTDREAKETITTEEFMLYGIGVLALLILLGIFGLRLANAKKDAKEMISNIGPPQAIPNSEPQSSPQAIQPQGISPFIPSQTHSETPQLSTQLTRSRLKEEVIERFSASPRIGKETISKILSHEGIEEASRYLHILGNIVVFELFEDSSLRRDLYDLSEYYNRANINLSLEDEVTYLNKLKQKLLATEIRMMASKNSAQFEFLSKLEPIQIFSLTEDESPKVQSIVLTQMSTKRRQEIFDLFHGASRINLLGELCNVDLVPKEYLANVAHALKKKMSQKPQFDAETIHSTEVIMDLIEQVSLAEQKSLMITLLEKSPEAARMVKSKLVTIEMIPYLKAGHLLEIILGLDREDLLIFLAGGPQQLRQLLLSNAPEELVESWMEELQTMGSVDEGDYKVVETKIVSRIRSLATEGLINIADINEIIFGNLSPQQDQDDPNNIIKMNPRNFAA